MEEMLLHSKGIREVPVIVRDGKVTIGMEHSEGYSAGRVSAIIDGNL
jgi:glutaredoxin